tara:strand:- start:106 stop:327 length:222 start_codon:yes stop_codon:yes gene_type:complete
MAQENIRTQIELAQYIADYLYVQDCPHDGEHIHNAIECFYDGKWATKFELRDEVMLREQEIAEALASDQLGSV